MIIREATIWDAIPIVNMWKDMRSEIPIMQGGNEEVFYIKLLQHIKNAPQSTVLVAEDESNKELIGFVLGYLFEVDYKSYPIGFCEMIYVKPKNRKLNIFKQMLDKITDIAIQNGALQLRFLTPYSDKKHWDFLGFNPIQIIYEKEVR